MFDEQTNERIPMGPALYLLPSLCFFLLENKFPLHHPVHKKNQQPHEAMNLGSQDSLSRKWAVTWSQVLGKTLA